MDINFVNLYGLITSIASVGLLSWMLRPGYKQLQRPKNGFTLLTVRLALQVIFSLVLIAPRVPFFLDRLQFPNQSTGAAIVSLTTSTLLFLFVYNMYKIYTFKEKK